MYIYGSFGNGAAVFGFRYIYVRISWKTLMHRSGICAILFPSGIMIGRMVLASNEEPDFRRTEATPKKEKGGTI